MLQSFELDRPQGRSFSRRENNVLFFLTFAGLLLRLLYAWGRSYLGDEVGTLILTDYSIFHLMTHFRVWLTMNAFIAAEKVVRSVLGSGPLSLGLLPLAFGTATIPLTALLALRLTTSRTAVVSAALVAFNPWHVMHSATIRSYSVLACLSVLTILLFLRWYSEKTARNGI